MVNEVTIRISAQDNFSTVLNKYNKAVKGAGDATDQAGKQTKGAKAQFTDMANVVQGVFGAAVIQKFGEAVGHLNAMGIESRKAKGVFSELTKEIGGYENILATLRQTTGGVVNDTLLMQSSNKLLLSGLAGNEDELNKIIELSTKLGSAMGEDAASSIENFSLMLLNQSIPRLDSFGISGSKVREEINRLIATGQAANREEAFKMAVFEQGALAIEKLGIAASVGETAMARMDTRLQNLVGSLGEMTAAGLEAGAQLAELGVIAAEMTAEGGGQGFMDVLNATANAVYSEVTGAEIAPIERQQQADANRQTWVDFANIAAREGQKALNVQNAITTSGAEYQSMIAGYQTSWDRAGVAVERHQQKVDRLVHMSGQAYNGVLGTIEDTWDRIVSNTANRNEALGAFDTLTGGFQSQFNNLSQTTISGNGMTFFDPGQVAELETELQRINAHVTRLAELNAQGLITDDELANAQALAEQFNTMANDAASMARNIEDLSLSELFGQGSGGQLTEAGNIVKGFIEDADIAGAFDDAFNLASGAETEVSQAFESSVAPALAAIAESQGAEAATHYLEAYLGAIQAGQTAGMGQDELVGAGAGMIPGTVDAEGNFVPSAIFPQPEGEGQAFGGGNELAAAGFSTLTDIIGETQTAVEDLSNTEVEVSTDAAQANVNALEALLQAIMNTDWKVVVDVEYNDPGAPGGAGGATGGGGSVGAQVRNNGGSIPGEDPRTGRIPIG